MQSRLLLLTVIMMFGLCGSAWAVDISCPVQSPGSVSLGIYDGHGRLVRTVLSGKKAAEAGTLTATWDGKDDLGNLLPAGNYTYQGLTANVNTEFLTMMGNSGRPVYPTADGSGAWGGVWGNVKSVITDPSGKYVYLLWAMEEGTPALLKIDPAGGEGKFKIWGAHTNWGWGYCQAMATDGEYVYIANNDSGSGPGGGDTKKTARSLVWRVRADNGDYALFPNEKDHGLLAVSEISTDLLPIEPARWEMYADHSKARSVGTRMNLVSIAVDATQLYCSLRYEHKIAIYNKTTGEHVKDIPVQNPGWLAVAPDRNILFIDGMQVKKMDADGTMLGMVLDTGLVAPYGMTVDAKGNMYISDQATAMQVKVFTPRGTLLKTIGKAGGRAYGGEWAKLRSNLLFPTAPGVTPDGNTLYVGEECAPKRVAIYHNGHFTDEWYGPLASGCGKMDTTDDAHPEYVYQAYVLGDLVRYKVDYKMKTAQLDAVWGYYASVIAQGSEMTAGTGRQGDRPSLIGGIKQNGVYQCGNNGGCIRHYGGETYLYLGYWPIGIFRIEGYNLIPCAVVGKFLYTDAMDWVSKNWPSRPKDAGNNPFHAYTWHDTNGDWEAQEHEVDWSLPPNWVQTNFYEATYAPYVDKDLNIYGMGWKIPCLGIDGKGNPLYSWSKATPIPQRPMGRYIDVAKKDTNLGTEADIAKVGNDAPNNIPGAIYPQGRGVSTFVDPDDGGYYLTTDVEGKGKGIGWASAGIFARVGKLSKDGQWIWLAGDKATGFVKPGQFYKPSAYAGIVHGCIVQSDWDCQLRAFDKDTGLFVGSFLYDDYRGKTDPGAVHVELTEAHVFTHPGDGEDYAVAGDSCGLRLFHLTGLKQVQRFTGTVTLAAPAQ